MPGGRGDQQPHAGAPIPRALAEGDQEVVADALRAALARGETRAGPGRGAARLGSLGAPGRRGARHLLAARPSAPLPHERRRGRRGLSRVVVLLSFPISLVAIALALLAVAALPANAWWVGGPALALCAVTAVPGVVGQDDLDAAGSTRSRPPASLWRSGSPSRRRCGQASRSRRACRATRSGWRSAPWSASSRCRGSPRSSASTCRAMSSSARRFPPVRRLPPSTSDTTTASTAPCSSPRPCSSRGAAPRQARWRVHGVRVARLRVRSCERRPGLLAGAAREARVGGLGDPLRARAGTRPIWLVIVALAAIAWWLLVRERAILRR